MSFRNYADHMMTEEFRRGITELLALAGEARTAYMCAERVYFRCHRMLVWVNDQRIDSALRFCLHRAREIARVSLAWFCFRCGDILHNACQSA